MYLSTERSSGNMEIVSFDLLELFISERYGVQRKARLDRMMNPLHYRICMHMHENRSQSPHILRSDS